jgi:serine protease Do
MKYFLRLVSATVTAGATALSPIILVPVAFAAEKPNASFTSQSQFQALFSDQPAFLANSSSGYLGVGLSDIDKKRAESLKLKEAAGAEIVNIDHDAPAASAGLKVHDVILQMNGQVVAGAEQLRRMLHETPPDRPITLVVSRDGKQQTINATLVDHAKLERNAASNITMVPAPGDEDGSIALAPPSSHSGGNSFFGSLPFGLSSFSVGVQLDTMGSQLADFFGVKDGQGLLVKHVAANSDASVAGLKAGDVVTKVDGHIMATLNDWTKTIRASRGKQVQVVIIRNRQQQILNLQAGDSKHKSVLVVPEGFPQAFLDGSMQPALAGDIAQLDGQNFQFDTEQLQRDAEKLQKELQPLQSFELKDFDNGKFQQQLQEQFKDQSRRWQQQTDQLKKDFQSWQWQEMD